MSELRSCPALPDLWPGACSDYLCHLKEVRREQYSQGRITSDVPAPLEIQAVRDLVRARGKEMQAENLNAQVAAQVCMGLPVLGSLSVACGGLAAAWINAAGFFVLTMASKLPSAKKYQRWVFSELAEQMTDMLPSSALFIHFSLPDSVSVLKHNISSAGTSPATCDFHASSCCSAGGCCTERRAASPVPANSFPAEAVAVGFSAEDGNDVHASHTGPL